MSTDVNKTIGQTSSPTTPDYSSLQAWEDAKPTNFTTSRNNTTVTGATSSTIILDIGASGTNDFYTGHPVWADARTSEKRLITAYNGTTKIATIGALNGSSATWDNIPTIEAYTVDACRWVGQCLDQGTFTTGLTITGSTSDSSSYAYLTTASGASFKDKAGVRTHALNYDNTTGVSLEQEFGVPVTISEANTVFEGIQGKRVTFYTRFMTLGADAITIRKCILANDAAGGTAGIVYSNNTNNKFVNCLLQSVADGIVFDRGQLIGCTLVRLGSAGGTAITSFYSAAVLTNCAVFNFTTLKDNNLGAGSDYNATDLATAWGVGTHNLNSLTFADQFVSSSNDFRAVDTGSLDTAGNPDSTNLPDDISGFTRGATSPTIGCWEAAAGGGGGAVIPVFLSRQRRMAA